jgi:hypothetical protein
LLPPANDIWSHPSMTFAPMDYQILPSNRPFIPIQRSKN